MHTYNYVEIEGWQVFLRSGYPNFEFHISCFNFSITIQLCRFNLKSAAATGVTSQFLNSNIHKHLNIAKIEYN